MNLLHPPALTLAGLTCQLTLEWLPSFVEAELCGVAHQARFADLRAHLTACPACAAEHSDLLETVLWRENLYLIEEEFRLHQTHTGRPI